MNLIFSDISMRIIPPDEGGVRQDLYEDFESYHEPHHGGISAKWSFIDSSRDDKLTKHGIGIKVETTMDDAIDKLFEDMKDTMKKQFISSRRSKL